MNGKDKIQCKVVFTKEEYEIVKSFLKDSNFKHFQGLARFAIIAFAQRQLTVCSIKSQI